jgi:hypothetical protein
MKEVVLTLPDKTYERLAAIAAAAHKSPQQWIEERLLIEQDLQMPEDEAHTLLVAALDALGFKRLAAEQAKRLSELLHARKKRVLSESEATELNTLMNEADALELGSLQRLAATLEG